jgi:hypothetical protein
MKLEPRDCSLRLTLSKTLASRDKLILVKYTFIIDCDNTNRKHFSLEHISRLSTWHGW